MTDDDDYAPFPEQRLQDMAEHFGRVGKILGEKHGAHWTRWSTACFDAVAGYTAVRERMLLLKLQLSLVSCGAGEDEHGPPPED